MISPFGSTASRPSTYCLRDAVLERARPAGALGDVAADHRLSQARRIRRIEQPDAFDRVLQIAGDDVRLDDREQVALVDLENAIQPLEAEDDAAVHRHGAAGVAGAAAARHERRARLVAQPWRSPRPRAVSPAGRRRRRDGRASARRRRTRRHDVRDPSGRAPAPTMARRRSSDGGDRAPRLDDSAARAARANRISRVTPSRSRSSEVAYDRRTKPGASNASPAVVTTCSSRSSAVGEVERRAHAVGRQEVADVRKQVERALRHGAPQARLLGQPRRAPDRAGACIRSSMSATHCLRSGQRRDGRLLRDRVDVRRRVALQRVGRLNHRLRRRPSSRSASRSSRRPSTRIRTARADRASTSPKICGRLCGTLS